MKIIHIITALALIFLVAIPLIDSFQGNSTDYDIEVNYDSFAFTNATSTDFEQRFIGGVKAVSTYFSISYTGRFGILNDTCAGDYGVWSDWSACISGSQHRTRTDSTGCIQTEYQSCTITVDSCFPAGTKILMADESEKNIENVVIGDYVMSYDEMAGESKISRVLEIESPLRDHMCTIIFNDASELKLTNEHPVYTSEGWKSLSPEETARENKNLVVEKLEIGDSILFYGNKYEQVIEIRYESIIIQTYNLKSIEKYNTFFAEKVLVHNKGDGCTPHWIEWSEWGRCIDGEQNRTREDGCGHTEIEFQDCTELICNDGIDNDDDGFTDCDDIDCDEDAYCIALCESDWDCSWTDCMDDGTGTYYSSPYDCDDLNECEDAELPEDVQCALDPETGQYVLPDGICKPKWNCTDWTICSPDYNLRDVLKGQATLEGIQTRNCNDLRECKSDKTDSRECSMAVPVEARKNTWCLEEYVEIYEIETNALVSRIKETSVKETNQIDIGFFVSDFQGYCDYCYDNLKDYDEIGVDCGGPSCPACIDKGSYYDWLLFVKLALWILLLILVVYFAYRNRAEMRAALTSQEQGVAFGITKPIEPKLRYRKLIVHKPALKKSSGPSISRIKNKMQDWKRKGYNTVRLQKELDILEGKKPHMPGKFKEYK